VPLDLIDAGTSAATFASAPAGVAGVDDVLEDEAALDEVVVELLLLLLPQPTITAALSSATSTADRRLQELLKIRLLLGGPQFRARISNNWRSRPER
jgi:hypothetical protein